MNDGFYPQPVHGWTCFHCGETFKTQWLARQHFGADPLKDPACLIKRSELGLVGRIRELERQLEKMCSEERDYQAHLERQHYGKEEELRRAVREAEECGFGKGLADGRAEANSR